jgi:hypothetical protein
VRTHACAPTAHLQVAARRTHATACLALLDFNFGWRFPGNTANKLHGAFAHATPGSFVALLSLYQSPAHARTHARACTYTHSHTLTQAQFAVEVSEGHYSLAIDGSWLSLNSVITSPLPSEHVHRLSDK